MLTTNLTSVHCDDVLPAQQCFLMTSDSEGVLLCGVLLQAVTSEAESVERATQRVFAELRALESDMLHTLSEQTSAEKSSSKTAADIRALRAASEAEELRIAGVFKGGGFCCCYCCCMLRVPCWSPPVCRMGA